MIPRNLNPSLSLVFDCTTDGESTCSDSPNQICKNKDVFQTVIATETM